MQRNIMSQKVTKEEELSIYRNLLIKLHTARWTGNQKMFAEIIEKIGAYSYARTNSNAGNEEAEKELMDRTLLALK